MYLRLINSPILDDVGSWPIMHFEHVADKTALGVPLRPEDFRYFPPGGVWRLPGEARSLSVVLFRKSFRDCSFPRFATAFLLVDSLPRSTVLSSMTAC